MKTPTSITAFVATISLLSLSFAVCPLLGEDNILEEDPSGSENTRNETVDSPEELKAKKKKIPDVADVSFEDGMTGKVFHNYLQVKMALVNSDAEGAAKAAANLAETFTEKRSEIESAAQQLADSRDLDVQRKHFSKLTEKLEPLFSGNLSEGSFYKQHCPMALDNQGASWFSDTREIENPYYGDRMLKCGSIEKEYYKK